MGKINRHINHHIGRHIERAKGMSTHKIHHHRTSKVTAVVLILSYVLLAVLGGIMVVDQIREQRNAKVNPSTQLASNSIGVRINTVKTGQKSQQPFIAPSGKSFVILDVSITNNRSQKFYFAPVLQTFITDNSREQYEMSPAVLDNPILAGYINPGKSTKGQLSYLVPENATGLVLHFVPKTEGAAPIEINLD